MHSESVTWLRGALDEDDLRAMDASDAGTKPGQRLSLNTALRAALEPVDRLINAIACDMRPVRAVVFNKTAATNWALPWHQDRVIAVQRCHDVPGFAQWSRKDGTWHCEPPVDVLASMLFVRVHLDDTDAASGAMQIAAGSHEAGLVPADQAAEVAGRYENQVCEAMRGDVLILPMLTLHRSLAATAPADRRVFRVDYAASVLPAPLAWAN